MACFPSIITAALFVAIIIFDLTRGSYRQVPGHALFGFFSVLVTNFICEKGSPVVAWILLLAPIILIFVSYLVRLIIYYIQKSGSSEPTIPAQPAQGSQLFVCETYPCKQNNTPKPAPVPIPAKPADSCPPPKKNEATFVEPKNGACIKPSLA